MPTSKLRISPSLMCADLARAGEVVRALEAGGADMLHFDVMDGWFVPNFALGPYLMSRLRPATTLEFDVHLMVEKPERYIDLFAETGAGIISIHAEACAVLTRAIARIKSHGAKAAVAINPATPLCAIENVLGDVGMVLLMTVEPGFRGQTFVPGVLKKIRQLRGMVDHEGLQVDIQVDGGMNEETIPLVLEAGANVIVAGSIVFDRGVPLDEAVAELKSRFGSEEVARDGIHR